MHWGIADLPDFADPFILDSDEGEANSRNRFNFNESSILSISCDLHWDDEHFFSKAGLGGRTAIRVHATTDVAYYDKRIAFRSCGAGRLSDGCLV